MREQTGQQKIERPSLADVHRLLDDLLWLMGPAIREGRAARVLMTADHVKEFRAARDLLADILAGEEVTDDARERD